MKKKLLSIFLSTMLILSFTLVVSAEEISNFGIEEKNEIIESIEEYGKQADNVKSYSTNRSVTTYDVRGYDLDKAYKIYNINGYIVNHYKEFGDFKSIIKAYEERNILYVPADNMIVMLATYNENGKYEVFGTVEYGNNDVDFIKETESLKNEIDEKVLEVTYLKSSLYQFDAIYLRTENNEYVAPYFYESMQRTVRERMERGKLYTAYEFILRMDSTFDTENNNPNANGGVPIKSWEEWDEASILSAVAEKTENEKNYFVVYAVVVGVVIVIGSAGVFIYEKKRKKQ